MFSEKFLFYTDPTGSIGLNHDSISMIVSRFTTFTENFVFCCNQVTTMFRSAHDCTSTSSARSPPYFSSSRYRNLGSSEKKCV